MVPSTNGKRDWHVLEFFTDDESDSALTTFISGRRFHIIASTEKLRKDTEVGREYYDLVCDVRGEKDETVDKENEPPKDQGSDSGVDVREVDEGSKDEQEQDEVETRTAEETLQAWMISPLIDSIDVLVPQNKTTVEPTVEEWYHGPTTFCELVASQDGSEIQAVELGSSNELERRMENLRPHILLPKSLTNKLTAPWFECSDLRVLECSDQPIGTPYHPCRVQHVKTREVYFLKVVDNEQPQPFKRELDVLDRMQEAKLHEQINVPRLEGLVKFDDSKPTSTGRERAMGMLLTDIPNPTSLITKLDKDVSQEKREVWAKEAERITDVLHEHEIVWGDAKADNFMVDEEEELWIIDFGGSYTEGWVDAEFNETEEGDDMGTEKVVNALKDPVANTYHPDEEDLEDGVEIRHGAKRKRGQEDGDSQENIRRSIKQSRVETPG